MMRHYQDLSSASDWSFLEGNLFPPISSTTQIWTSHWYGIAALVPQTSFHGETRDGVAKCRLFSQSIRGLLVLVFLETLYYCGFYVFSNERMKES